MKSILAILFLTVMASSVYAEAEKKEHHLKIFSNQETDRSYQVGEGESAITITRTWSTCARNGGWLQEIIPASGVKPVTEIEVLKSMNDSDFIIIDMRYPKRYFAETIPTAINIPYNEVSFRLDELGCEQADNQLNCDQAKNIIGFCNGPVCPQSPIAMRAMIKKGFPAEKIHYYRGGILDWTALGFTTVEGE